jgi:hypothetical protein
LDIDALIGLNALTFDVADELTPVTEFGAFRILYVCNIAEVFPTSDVIAVVDASI